MKWLWISGLISMLGIGTPLAWRMQQQDDSPPRTAPPAATGTSSAPAAAAAESDPFFGTTAPATSAASTAQPARAAFSPNSGPIRYEGAVSTRDGLAPARAGATTTAPANVGLSTTYSDQLAPAVSGLQYQSTPAVITEYRSALAAATGPSAEEMRLKTETAQLLAQIRGAADGEPRTELMEQLTAKTAEYFDLLQQQRKAELADLEARLAEVRQRIEARESARGEIVARRVRELTGDVSLDWDESVGRRDNVMVVPRQIRSFDPTTGQATEGIVYEQRIASIETDWLPAAPSPPGVPSLPNVSQRYSSSGIANPGVPVPSFPSTLPNAPAPPMPSPPVGPSFPGSDALPGLGGLPSVSESNTLPPLTLGSQPLDDNAIERMLMADFDQPQHWAAAQLAHARLMRQRALSPGDAPYIDRNIEIIGRVLATRLMMLGNEYETYSRQLGDAQQNVARLHQMFESGQIPEPMMRKAESEEKQAMDLLRSKELLREIARQTVELYDTPSADPAETEDEPEVAPAEETISESGDGEGDSP